MKSFFEAIQWLFEKIIFALHDVLRSEELTNWWIANIISWAFVAIVSYYTWYWIKQLKLHKDNNEEYQDTTAHSFLK
ncbi:MAG: uracil phosphoribosyltransferase [Flavobacterium sp.]